MLVSVKPYNTPQNTDTCVAICFFRPIEYSKPLKNLSIFLKDLSDSKIPFYSIELLYENQTPTLQNPTKIVRSKSKIFSKENLWNILETHIPDIYRKIIFLDTDIRFSNPDWFNLSSELLSKYKVVQPMEYCYRDIFIASYNYSIDETILYPSIAKAISKKENINICYHYPGFGIGIDRDFFHEIGGIYDQGFDGGGDTLFWGCFGDFRSTYLHIAGCKFSKYDEYQKKVITKINNDTTDIVSYVQDNTALHLYHGSKKNRKYGSRHKYIPNNYTLFYNNEGVLEIESDHDLTQYFIDRQEDS
jgi:hypothetical protein